VLDTFKKGLKIQEKEDEEIIEEKGEDNKTLQI